VRKLQLCNSPGTAARRRSPTEYWSSPDCRECGLPRVMISLISRMTVTYVWKSLRVRSGPVWPGYGGGQYASSANLATPAQQMAVAQRVLSGQGIGARPVCGARG
jgi:Transglycosylase-like domain